MNHAYADALKIAVPKYCNLQKKKQPLMYLRYSIVWAVSSACIRSLNRIMYLQYGIIVKNQQQWYVQERTKMGVWRMMSWSVDMK